MIKKETDYEEINEENISVEEDIIDDDYTTNEIIEDEISDVFDEELMLQEELDDIDIEVSESEITNTIDCDESESDLDVYFKYNTNNHKLEGKHSLKRDTILNGKLNESQDNVDESLFFDTNTNMDYDDFGYETSNLSIERGSVFEDESKRGDDILNKRKLSEDVYELLKENTDLDFSANRRKPNKIVFNNYYRMLLNSIDKQYSKCDIFVELSYYFTDNIFNMYKLLERKYAVGIIKELKEKGHLSKLSTVKFK